MDQTRSASPSHEWLRQFSESDLYVLSMVPRSAPIARRLSKVPDVTALFWTIKILTTGMGEAASDFFNHTIGPAVAVPVAFVLFCLAMVMQLRAPQYRPARYWFAVAMVAVFGTMIADAIHVALGVPYLVSTAAFTVLLIVVMVAWRRREGTVSIHQINSKNRELFYWTTVIVTFALGTALGDLTAVTFGWGYLTSGVVFAFAFAIPLVARAKFKLNEVACFWSAYIITRPLGASFADWLGVPPDRSGLGAGSGVVALVLAAIIVALVAGLSIAARKAPVHSVRPPRDPDGIRLSQANSG